MTDFWIKMVLYIAVVYTVLCATFYFLQPYFFFRPEILPRGFQYQYPFPFEEVNFPMKDGGSINGIHFKVPNSRGVVFYIKGNSRSVKGWGKFARDFLGKGYDFFMIDYRGFGKSTGKRSEAIIYSDLQHIYDWLLPQYPESKIILYGRSLGSGFATHLAAHNHPKMLVLDCPYYSFLANLQRYNWLLLPLRWLLQYHIRTDLFIKNVTCPIFILHGRKDKLIPYAHSERLVVASEGKAVLYPIENAGHNNLPNFAEYHDYLYDILNDDAFYELLKWQSEERHQQFLGY
jgi:pimeloyl-ACP methyl ester carboxylesterase